MAIRIFNPHSTDERCTIQFEWPQGEIENQQIRRRFGQPIDKIASTSINAYDLHICLGRHSLYQSVPYNSMVIQ